MVYPYGILIQMTRQNPAIVLRTIVECVETASTYTEDGRKHGGPSWNGPSFVRTLGLVDTWGKESINYFLAFNECINYLEVSAERLPDTKKKLYAGVFSNLRAFLAWDFSNGRYHNFQQPPIDWSELRSHLTHLAIEIEELGEWTPVPFEKIANWLAQIDELELSISDSELSFDSQHALLTAIGSVRSALKTLHRFGPAAMRTDLSRSFGDLFMAENTMKQKGDDTSKLEDAYALFKSVVETVSASAGVYAALKSGLDLIVKSIDQNSGNN